MSDNDTINMLIGELKGQQTATDKRLTALEIEVKDRLKGIETKIDALMQTLAAGRGGWRAVMIMGSIVLTLAGAIAWAFDHISFKERAIIERNNP